MQVGTTKDRGLCNKPSAAVHPVILTAGTLPQYNTIHMIYESLQYQQLHGFTVMYLTPNWFLHVSA